MNIQLAQPIQLSIEDKLKKAEIIFRNLDVSENTIKDYLYRIPIFLNFIEKNGFNINSYSEFKRWLKEQEQWTTASKNKYLITAKIFLKELAKQNIIPVDITQNVKCFEVGKKHKKEGLNDEEINKIIDYVKNLDDTPINIRLKLIISLLLFQGLRQVEIIRLDIEDIDLIDKTAYILGKGKDTKELIYLHPEVVEIIKKHIKINSIGSGALLKSFSNRKSKDNRISRMFINREVKKIFEILDIRKTIHGFRHYYITTLLKNFDINQVRKFSRHNSYDMLIVYDDELDMKEKVEDVFKIFNFNILNKAEILDPNVYVM